MKKILHDFILFFLNHIVAHIPCWSVRKFFYIISGMKIGKNTRILMGLYVFDPWKIEIGNNVYINEKCFLDGRGGLVIKDNTSISIYTKILTGTHLSFSDNFDYVTRKVILDTNVWTGIGCTILPGVYLPHGVILAASSVAIHSKNKYKPLHIYSGVPAIEIGIRNTEANYELENWRPLWR